MRLNRSIARSRRRSGWCKFSTRLFIRKRYPATSFASSQFPLTVPLEGPDQNRRLNLSINRGALQDDGKYAQLAFRAQENRKIRSSDGCGGKTIPTAAQFGRHCHEIYANMGRLIWGSSLFLLRGNFHARFNYGQAIRSVCAPEQNTHDVLGNEP